MIQNLIETHYRVTDEGRAYLVIVPAERQNPIKVTLEGQDVIALECPDHIITPIAAARWFKMRMYERQQQHRHAEGGALVGPDLTAPQPEPAPTIEQNCKSCRHFMPDGDGGNGICCKHATTKTITDMCGDWKPGR